MTGEVLRTGVLFKKGSGIGPFGRRNWKPRYFVLTTTKLTYYTYEDGDLKGEVDITGCNEQSLEVMPADAMKTGSSASTIWRIAINANDRRLLVAAGTEMEMNDWVEQFRVAFSMNSGQPLPPQRNSMLHLQQQQTQQHQQAPGAIASTIGPDYSRNSITDFQNFTAARKSVSGTVRASIGVHGGHEFRLSDEHERMKQAELERHEELRRRAEMDAERQREEEAMQLHLRTQAEERRKQKEKLQQQQSEELQLEQDRQREELLDEQRRLKREQHERDREEAERKMRELELQQEQHEQEKQKEHKRRQEAEMLRQLEDHHDHLAHRFSSSSASSSASSASRSPTAMPPHAPPPHATHAPSHSSVIGDAKKEAMLRQQAEHNKRREAAIKQEQERMRQDFLAEKKQHDDELRARQSKHQAAPPRAAHAPMTPPDSPPQPQPQPSGRPSTTTTTTSFEF